MSVARLRHARDRPRHSNQVAGGPQRLPHAPPPRLAEAVVLQTSPYNKTWPGIYCAANLRRGHGGKYMATAIQKQEMAPHKLAARIAIGILGRGRSYTAEATTCGHSWR